MDRLVAVMARASKAIFRDLFGVEVLVFRSPDWLDLRVIFGEPLAHVGRQTVIFEVSG